MSGSPGKPSCEITHVAVRIKAQEKTQAGYDPSSLCHPHGMQGEARRLVEDQAEAALASEDVVELRHELVEFMAKYDKASEENSQLRWVRTGLESYLKSEQ